MQTVGTEHYSVPTHVGEMYNLALLIPSSFFLQNIDISLKK